MIFDRLRFLEEQVSELRRVVGNRWSGSDYISNLMGRLKIVEGHSNAFRHNESAHYNSQRRENRKLHQELKALEWRVRKMEATDNEEDAT